MIQRRKVSFTVSMVSPELHTVNKRSDMDVQIKTNGEIYAYSTFVRGHSLRIDCNA